jgi:CDP-2,3-bis-(O-geranylgeranyl)-sn-glycerol synthase
MRTLFEIAWLILPACLANMAPVFTARLLPALKAPVDGGLTFGGVRIFGDHKTIRGLVAGALVGTLVFSMQQVLYERFGVLRELSRFDYAHTSYLLGAALGLGALGGDLVKSFFKRRVGLPPGRPWFPFDQTDWMAGALVVTWQVAHLDAIFAASALAFAVVASLLIKSASYRLGLERRST